MKTEIAELTDEELEKLKNRVKELREIMFSDLKFDKFGRIVREWPK